jgi:hypothetical protein
MALQTSISDEEQTVTVASEKEEDKNKSGYCVNQIVLANNRDTL